MKRSTILRIAAIANAAITASCAMFQSDPSHPPKAQPAAQPPTLVGRIASVPADKRFVLIQSYGTWNIQTGTILTSRGAEDRTANLLVTGESLGQFAAADLQSGLVDVGDAVYSRHIPQPTASPATPEPTENEIPATPNDVLKNN